MARGEDGRLVDPHGGAADLRAGVLRHVSPAFSEDPVRILRVARFAARFGFAVAPETLALMQSMVRAGEADALVAERVWQEISRGLREKTPSRMLAVLRECGALARVLPELDAAVSAPDIPERLAARLDHSAARGNPLETRYALLVLDLEAAAANALATRINVPTDCRDVARLAIQERELLARADALDAESTLGLIERSDLLRRPERLDRLVEVAEADHPSQARHAEAVRRALALALQAARSVDAGTIAREHPDDIPGAVRRARLTAIAALQPPTGH
jgi:tRNA nucleotidyltransferase (CCA-adding enzyme)